MLFIMLAIIIAAFLIIFLVASSLKECLKFLDYLHVDLLDLNKMELEERRLFILEKVAQAWYLLDYREDCIERELFKFNINFNDLIIDSDEFSREVAALRIKSRNLEKEKTQLFKWQETYLNYSKQNIENSP